MVRRFEIRRPMLVDDLDGTVHRAYGLLPNMTYVMGRGGTVRYRADWTDAGSVARAVEEIQGEGGRRAAGARLTPFYVEMTPQRSNEIEAFMEGLLTAGPRAVEEFIAAIRTTRGEAASRAMETWWASRREDGKQGNPAG